VRKIDWEAANAICGRLSVDRDLLVREIVTQISEKWTVSLVSVPGISSVASVSTHLAAA
jgi:hypothetical protein